MRPVLLTRAAHHLLMIEGASAPRQSLMTCHNARSHLDGVGNRNRVNKTIGSISGHTRIIDWRVEKEPGCDQGWLHARLRSAKVPLEWRIDDNTMSLSGVPESVILRHRERLSVAPFPANDIVDLPFLTGRMVEDVDGNGAGAILILSGSHRDDAVAHVPMTMGDWRNAGMEYVKHLKR